MQQQIDAQCLLPRRWTPPTQWKQSWWRQSANSEVRPLCGCIRRRCSNVIERDVGFAYGTNSHHAGATGQWKALQTKVAADLDRLKVRRAQHQHEHDVKRAKDHADRMEREAGIAIEYAIASIEDAKIAVLDAVIANVEAQEAESA
jgi:hypothetical protein